jgi:aspartyl-tRNA(Asn)/glutamyl-tRNA(Gln) amidotransferase subunit A
LNSTQALLSAVELTKLLSSGEITASQLHESRRRTIAAYNDKLNAFITVFKGKAPQPTPGAPLRGVTLAVKDNFYTEGHRTTAGSRILRGFVPSSDAEVVSRLKSAGAVLLGKTNLHEFAFGATNINPHFGDCKNPWKLDRISGGSSGGSAVAVARGMACSAIGTDTAGSVRIPAALCGVVGYKPTYGLVSRRGIVPLAWSLDSVGFLTRSVEDASLLASIASGKEKLVRLRLKPGRVRGLKIGVPQNMLDELDEGVRKRYDEALVAAENEGARLVRFNFAHLKEISACRSLIVHAEAASYHRQYFSTRYREYGEDLRLRLAQGLAIPAAVYLDAQRVRGVLLDYYRSVFARVDLMALPTTRIPAPTLKASKSPDTSEGIRSALLALTEPFSLFGAPAITIPCGLTREGLPVGLQLAGDIYADDRLLSAALSLERLFPKILERLDFGD